MEPQVDLVNKWNVQWIRQTYTSPSGTDTISDEQGDISWSYQLDFKRNNLYDYYALNADTPQATLYYEQFGNVLYMETGDGDTLRWDILKLDQSSLYIKRVAHFSSNSFYQEFKFVKM